MSLSLLASRSMISTDRRHIDPNPDRLPINLNNLSTSNATSTITTTTTPKPSSVSSSLLLLSTSAEAAVLESRKFERGSRPSSLQPILTSNQSASQSSNPKQNSSISPPTHHHHHSSGNISQQQQRLHHRSLETLAPLHHLNSKRDHKHAHLFKCEKCPKVYRHPQCLVKHRWEHTSYWADASKLMLSKHQQVQMLEAAAILATPSGSLPESRSLWPAAVSPSEAGLLGSDQVNLDVIQSQAKSYKPADHQQHRSSSSPCSSVLTASTPTAMKMRKAGSEDMEMDEDEDEDDIETGDEEEEDEIMFEMSINGDDSQSATSNTETGSGSSGEKSGPGMMVKEDNNSRSLPITFSISAPPPMGYFQPRPTTLTTTLVQDVRKPTEPVPAFVAFPNSRTASICSVGRSYYNPETIFNPPPYADSGLRFQDKSKLEENVNQTEEGEEEDEEDEDVGFGVREVGGMNGSGDEVIGMEL